MKFGPVPISAAKGKILGHNVAGADGRRVIRKGSPLTAVDISLLQSLGRTTVYVAELEPGDVDEDTAAGRVSAAVMGPGLQMTGPSTGRANLKAAIQGLLRVDVSRLYRLNSQLGITLATQSNHAVVNVGRMVGTIKVIPYAVSETAVAAIEAIAAESGPLIRVDPLPQRQVDVILSGSPAAKERIINSFEPPLRERITALGSTIGHIDFIPLEDEQGEAALAQALRERAAQAGMIILAGDTAIMDIHDIAPRAVLRASGDVTCYGAPVDPGNLLMMAYIGTVPVLGAPGCVRSPKANIVDRVLPRLLAGDRLTQADIIAWGHGGLLEDVPERPLPRSKIDG